MLRDVLDGCAISGKEKSKVPCASYYKREVQAWYERVYSENENKQQHDYVAVPVRVGSLPRPNGELSTSQGMRVYSIKGKSINLTSSGGGQGSKTGLYAIPIESEGNIPIKAVSCADEVYTVYEVRDGQIAIKDKQYPIKLTDGFYIIRKLTVSECKRLQTVPEWYDFSVVSNTQAYKMFGNGWTCDIISHLIRATRRKTK